MNLKEIIDGKGDFATKQVGDDLVLVPVKDNVAEMNEMFTLNDVGAFIWNNLQGDVTQEELATSLSKEFDVDEETVSSDLNEFLIQLQKMING
ncbi:MAG: PqqD family protein [Flavobacteriales bacterium]